MTETTPPGTAEWVPVHADIRQQVLVLYLASSALEAPVVAWSVYDPAATAAGAIGEADEPPYRTGLDALRDGWRLLSMSQLLPPPRGLEYSTDHHNFEFVFERLLTRPGREKR